MYMATMAHFLPVGDTYNMHDNYLKFWESIFITCNKMVTYFTLWGNLIPDTDPLDTG